MRSEKDERGEYYENLRRDLIESARPNGRGGIYRSARSFGSHTDSEVVEGAAVVIRGTSADNNIVHVGDINTQNTVNNINLHFHINALNQEEADSMVSKIMHSINKIIGKSPKEFNHEPSDIIKRHG